MKIGIIQVGATNSSASVNNVTAIQQYSHARDPAYSKKASTPRQHRYADHGGQHQPLEEIGDKRARCRLVEPEPLLDNERRVDTERKRDHEVRDH